MTGFSVLLVTGRPAVESFFVQLGQQATPPFAVIPVPASEDSIACAPHTGLLATATVAVVDVTPDPVVAIQVCRALRAQRPTLPLAALFCCPRAITSWHLRMFLSAGVTSLLDLQATGAEVVRVLQSIARGDVVLHVQLIGGHGGMVEDLAAGNGSLGQARPAGHRQSTMAGILQLLVRGMTDREIGAHLHLSPHTIKHHIEHLRDEAGARNRIELAAWAGRQGFYSPAMDGDSYVEGAVIA